MPAHATVSGMKYCKKTDHHKRNYVAYSIFLPCHINPTEKKDLEINGEEIKILKVSDKASCQTLCFNYIGPKCFYWKYKNGICTLFKRVTQAFKAQDVTSGSGNCTNAKYKYRHLTAECPHFSSIPDLRCDIPSLRLYSGTGIIEDTKWEGCASKCEDMPECTEWWHYYRIGGTHSRARKNSDCFLLLSRHNSRERCYYEDKWIGGERGYRYTAGAKGCLAPLTGYTPSHYPKYHASFHGYGCINRQSSGFQCDFGSDIKIDSVPFPEECISKCYEQSESKKIFQLTYHLGREICYCHNGTSPENFNFSEDSFYVKEHLHYVLS